MIDATKLTAMTNGANTSNGAGRAAINPGDGTKQFVLWDGYFALLRKQSKLHRIKGNKLLNGPKT